MALAATFASKISDESLTVGIIGLGYVGLPTAIGFHDAGFEVWGVDVSQRTVDMVMEKPNRRPDVDDIVPAPGTENPHIMTSTAEAVPLRRGAVTVPRLSRRPNPDCPRRGGSAGLGRFQKARTPPRFRIHRLPRRRPRPGCPSPRNSAWSSVKT